MIRNLETFNLKLTLAVPEVTEQMNTFENKATT